MLNWLVADAEPESFRIARIGVGIAALIQAPISFGTLVELTDPGTLTTPVIGGLGFSDRWQVVVLAAIWVLAGFGFVFGYRRYLTGTLLGASLALTLLLDHQAYSNHLYLMVLMVGLLTVAGGRGGSGAQSPNGVVMWPVFLVMAQVSTVYLFSALTKVNQEFVNGRVLASTIRDGVITVPESLLTPANLRALAVLTVFVELFIAVFLWGPRLRWAAFTLGAGLHLMILLLMPWTAELAAFGLLMLASYPLFSRRPPFPPLGSGRQIRLAIGRSSIYTPEDS